MGITNTTNSELKKKKKQNYKAVASKENFKVTTYQSKEKKAKSATTESTTTSKSATAYKGPLRYARGLRAPSPAQVLGTRAGRVADCASGLMQGKEHAQASWLETHCSNTYCPRELA